MHFLVQYLGVLADHHCQFKMLGVPEIPLEIFITWIVISTTSQSYHVITTTENNSFKFHGSMQFADATGCLAVGRLGQFATSLF